MVEETSIALDTETFPMATYAVAPKLVCVSLASWADDKKTVHRNLLGNGDPELHDTIRAILVDPEVEIIGHNIKYDMAVIVNYFPDLMEMVWAAYDACRIHDTRVREKLLNLVTTGRLEFMNLPDGTAKPISYSLGALVKHYGIGDRDDVKNSDDAWRTHYQMLDGKRAVYYPAEAMEYAQTDASDTLLVYEEQEQVAEAILTERGLEAFTTEVFHTGVDFALYFMTAWGMTIDLNKMAEVAKMVEQELAPERLKLLTASGILRPPVLPREYKTTPGKFTKGKPASVDRKKLLAHVERVCLEHGIEVQKTEPTDRAPEGQTKADAEVMEMLGGLDPVLAEYQHRQSLQKLVTTELPRMSGGIVHPMFDVLKETGRTSSSANDLYASGNIQNVDPRARPCYVPRPGWLLCSVDFSQLEFCSMAQKCLDLGFESVMAQRLNACRCKGLSHDKDCQSDPHAFLASRLCYALDSNFRQLCDEAGIVDPFPTFFECKGSENPAARELFKKYRKLSKPVGFGLPGGLGNKTFVSFARGVYKVIVTLEEAEQLRQLWFETYPEMKQYFSWIENDCIDVWNQDRYVYRTPLGMWRSGCAYTAAANGALLQSPAADGAKMATYDVVRACYDSSLGSCLFGTRPVAFIHDEILIELPDDEYAHDRAQEVQRFMAGAMQRIMSQVPIKTNAVLMRRWMKDIDPTFDGNGRLVVTEEKK